ncbi:MAG: DUF2764 family protein [Verrucomicrobia bacterium]|nr:DUF2764 family protein [Verrucomicrobiota bacterium]
MANYYFLATLLPTLRIGATPEIGSRELAFFLRQNLQEDDLEKVAALRRLVDIENIQSIWRKEPIRDEGNFNELELEESLLFQEGLPSYVIDFMNEYKETAQRLKAFPQLLHRFFETEMSLEAGFLADYFRFEWEWRIAFVALRARELGRDMVTEMEYEDPENPFVAELLAQSGSNTFALPEPYFELQKIFELNKHSPLGLYQTLLEWRFNKIETYIEWESYSITRILGYIAQLDIVEEWLKLDKRKGIEVVNRIIEQSQVGERR